MTRNRHRDRGADQRHRVPGRSLCGRSRHPRSRLANRGLRTQGCDGGGSTSADTGRLAANGGQGRSMPLPVHRGDRAVDPRIANRRTPEGGWGDDVSSGPIQAPLPATEAATASRLLGDACVPALPARLGRAGHPRLPGPHQTRAVHKPLAARPTRVGPMRSAAYPSRGLGRLLFMCHGPGSLAASWPPPRSALSGSAGSQHATTPDPRCWHHGF